jgi:glucosamine kinase
MGLPFDLKRTCVKTSAMAYFLGIDGGGTKTRCAIGDETTMLAAAMSGGSNLVRLGEAQARDALSAAVHAVCAAAKISLDQIQAICIGVAGAARPEVAGKIRSILEEVAPGVAHAKIEVAGDSVIALEAAFGEGPGVIAISGTGSIVHGRNAAGRTARAGGWGFAISDEGSGHWIGRRAVSAILNVRDRNGHTALEDMILQAWKLTTMDELVQTANSTPPPDFPRLFPIVLRAADEGDRTARDLLSKAGAELAKLATIVLHGLAAEGPPKLLPVALTGSVFRQSSQVRQAFYNALQATFSGIEVRPDTADPAEGALARARRIASGVDGVQEGIVTSVKHV